MNELILLHGHGARHGLSDSVFQYLPRAKCNALRLDIVREEPSWTGPSLRKVRRTRKLKRHGLSESRQAGCRLRLSQIILSCVQGDQIYRDTVAMLNPKWQIALQGLAAPCLTKV